MFLGLLFFPLLHILLGIFKKEEFLLSLHFSADVAAIQGSIPLLLVLLRIKSEVDVEPFLILLDGQDDEDVWLGVVVDILYLMHLDCPHAC